MSELELSEAERRQIERLTEEVVKNFLRGQLTLDEAVQKLPAPEPSVLGHLLKVILPDELYRRWMEYRSALLHAPARRARA